MKCLDCKYLSIDDRHPVTECGCSYGVADGRWNFSIGYTDGKTIDMLVYPDFVKIDVHPRCPIKQLTLTNCDDTIIERDSIRIPLINECDTP